MTGPCEGCPRVARGLDGPCKGEHHKRFCALAASGHAAYIALLCDELPPVPPDPDRAAILARRAGKVRIALGERAPEVSPGRR